MRLDDGEIVVTFERPTRERRKELFWLARRYTWLFKSQLDVSQGEKPQADQPLTAAGRVGWR